MENLYFWMNPFVLNPFVLLKFRGQDLSRSIPRETLCILRLLKPKVVLTDGQFLSKRQENRISVPMSYIVKSYTYISHCILLCQKRLFRITYFLCQKRPFYFALHTFCVKGYAFLSHCMLFVSKEYMYDMYISSEICQKIKTNQLKIIAKSYKNHVNIMLKSY